MQEVLFIATGFGVVMGVLIALWGMCMLVGAMFRAVEAARARAETSPDAAAAIDPDQIPPAHLAAIAGAVAALSTPSRIVRIRMPPHSAPAWELQGRLKQQSKYSRVTWLAGGRGPVERPLHRDKEGHKS